MRRTLTVILLVLTVGFCKRTCCQDLHFSQFWNSPMSINPAHTGQFNGDYRFIGNQRTQWKSVTIPYMTIGLSADVANFMEKKNIGTGLSFYYDQAGDSHFKTIQFNLAGSYSFHIDDSTNTVIGGLQAGITNRNLDYGALKFDNQYNGLFYDAALPNLENFSRDSRVYPNLNTGISYHYHADVRKDIYGGISFYNMLKPKQSFFDNNDILLDMRLNIEARGSLKVAEKVDVQPGLLFSKQGTMKEILVGASANYILNNNVGMYRSVYAGIWMRNKDAGYIHLGMDYDTWNVGISYDLNYSGLVPASNMRGGLEVSVVYIISLYHPHRVKHKVCPNFI